MRVLVIGGGGREHALCWKIARSPLCEWLGCAPGNAGIASEAELLEVDPTNHEAVEELCREQRVDLVVVGPEAPLVAGLPDHLRAAGVAVFGPDAAPAQLEGSKAFAKDFMERHGIPTAGCSVFDKASDLVEHLETCPLPTVVKADGLAGGKGVLICFTREEAREAGKAMTAERRFGEASARVVVEDFMEGEEATVFALVAGEEVVVLQASQDHKRRFDADQGPNTGGMGAYTPVPSVNDEIMARVHAEVLEPTARGLVAEGTPYRGLLYAGLMLTEDGPKVVEYNCRFGDPECQPILLAMESDLLPLLAATARGELAGVTEPVFYSGSTLCVVLVSGGYPGAYPKGLPISGLGSAAAEDAVVVFHAGTRRDGEGQVVTSGGRVLGVTARGESVAEARKRAYAAVEMISWEGMDYRRDIAFRALKRQGV
ncbi:MAG: phosphoribosylamine--glycine ligase [Myxococcota bacterium]|nr:phosphoribosylamine--glycine ligase [Myxococcota bacterium]